MDAQLAQKNMIKQQIQPWDVMESKVLVAFAKINRSNFTANKNLAFADIRLPILDGHDSAVMLEPKIEARILQAVDINENDDILEIGTGSGYMTALLAHLGKQVDSIEINPEISKIAKSRLESFTNVNLIVSNGIEQNYKSKYDVIIVSGGLRAIPENLKNSLKENGKLFVFITKTAVTTSAVLMHRFTGKTWNQQTLFETSVPNLLVENNDNEEEFVF